jgi:hypothetical protein
MEDVVADAEIPAAVREMIRAHDLTVGSVEIVSLLCEVELGYTADQGSRPRCTGPRVWPLPSLTCSRVVGWCSEGGDATAARQTVRSLAVP